MKDFMNNEWSAECIACEIGKGNIIPPGGIIPLVYFLVLLTIMFIQLYIVKRSPLYTLMRNGSDKGYSLLFAMFMDIPSILLIAIILKFRKQSITSIGIRKKGLKSSLAIGGGLFIVLISKAISKNGISLQLLYNVLFYMVFVGFYEEIVFRGFLWPRLVVGFGKLWGTLMSGLFFGVMHIPLDIVFNNKSFVETVVYGHTSNANIKEGIISALMFIYIYTRNENIILPSFIHGIMDMS